MTFEEWWKDCITKNYTLNNTELHDIAKAAWKAAQSQQKPSWKDAPEWANYFAKDRDARWFWFEHEPLINPAIRCWTRKIDGRIQLARDDEDSWKQSLRKRP
jgi:hypothetical protein